MEFKDLNILDVGNKLDMVGVVYADHERVFICMFPDELFVEPFPEVLPMNEDEWGQFLYQSDVLETEAKVRDKDGTIVKAMLRKSQRQIDTRLQWKVWKKANYACCYCGNDDTPLTVDHLIPWEEGGPTIEANLLSACKKCNKARGSMLYKDWIVSPYYVAVAEGISPEQQQRNAALADTLEGIRRVYVRSR